MRIPFTDEVRENARDTGYSMICLATSAKPDSPLAEQVMYGTVPVDVADQFMSSLRDAADSCADDDNSGEDWKNGAGED